MKNDPRDTKCVVNTWGKHKWARSIRDQISKAQFVQILRCRYCAHYVGIEFNRVILPSGRVEIFERPFAISKAEEVTNGLQSNDYIGDDMKHIDNAQRLKAHV